MSTIMFSVVDIKIIYVGARHAVPLRLYNHVKYAQRQARNA